MSKGFTQFNSAKGNLTGFTLTEILVTVTLFVLILGAVFSSYLLSQRGYLEGERSSELAQNGRVILERTTREIRQARGTVTELPVDLASATSTIEFEDGNISERYHYIHYFKDNSEVKREVKRYYFSEDPNTFVIWSATPPPGEHLVSTVTQPAQTVGEFVQDLNFWSSQIAVVNVLVNLEKQGKLVDFSTRIFGRNL